MIPNKNALKLPICALHYNTIYIGHLEPYSVVSSVSLCYYWPWMAINVRSFYKQY